MNKVTKSGARTPSKIVVKLGSALLSSTETGLDLPFLQRLAAQVAELKRRGVGVGIVSSGAVMVGRWANAGSGLTRTALASIGQTTLIAEYARAFKEHGLQVSQTLLTRADLNTRAGYLNVRNTLNALLNSGVVPLVNENDPISAADMVGKIYANNDQLAAMVANAVDADLLVLLGRTEGLFDEDPARNPQAKMVKQVDKITADVTGFAKSASDGVGQGGMSSKLDAAKLATSSGTAMVIGSGNTKDILLKLCAGEQIGTFFPPSSTHREARKRWMVTGLAEQCGTLAVDDGATTALKERGVSLLPAGIANVSGDFKRGDIVEVNNLAGDTVAFGLANYSAAEMNLIKGLHSDEIKKMLKNFFGVEAIHRNNLTLV